MDKFSENKLKQFSNFAGKYNTGKYAGREGFNKLAYELLAGTSAAAPVPVCLRKSGSLSAKAPIWSLSASRSPTGRRP